MSASTVTAAAPPVVTDLDPYANAPLATDVAIATEPPDARRAAAQAAAGHIAEQLRAGRSLFNVILDPAVRAHIGADGRARVTPAGAAA